MYSHYLFTHLSSYLNCELFRVRALSHSSVNHNVQHISWMMVFFGSLTEYMVDTSAILSKISYFSFLFLLSFQTSYSSEMISRISSLPSPLHISVFFLSSLPPHLFFLSLDLLFPPGNSPQSYKDLAVGKVFGKELKLLIHLMPLFTLNALSQNLKKFLTIWGQHQS